MLIRHLVHRILASFHAPSLHWAVESASTYDAGSIRLLLVVFGLTMTRLRKQYWQAFPSPGNHRVDGDQLLVDYGLCGSCAEF